MSKRKLYCILEQSGEKPNEETFARKQTFLTDFSDYLRINWKTPDDELSSGFYPGITWSEGRSMLYEFVRGKYEYVIFMDDDIRFEETEKDIAQLIAEDLETYSPLSGTFYDRSDWTFKYIDPEKARAKPCFPVYAFDLQTFIMKDAFASKMMPVPFHGFDKSMWYIQYVASELWPEKQLAFTRPEVRNTRHVLHINDKKGTHPLHGDFLFWRFSKVAANNHKIPPKLDQRQLQKLNETTFENSVSSDLIDPSDEKLESILKMGHEDLNRRTPIINYTYSLRNSLQYYRWLFSYPYLKRAYHLWRQRFSSMESTKRLNKLLGRRT